MSTRQLEVLSFLGHGYMVRSFVNDRRSNDAEMELRYHGYVADDPNYEPSFLRLTLEGWLVAMAILDTELDQTLER
jgi:hypothetical protein